MKSIVEKEITVIPDVLNYLATFPDEVVVLETSEQIAGLISLLKEGETFAGGVYVASEALKLQRYLLAEDNNLACLNTGTYIIPEEKTGPNRTIRPLYRTELNIPLVRPISKIKGGEFYE